MKKIIYINSCDPSYFQGFSGETLIAFHWTGQTVNEAIKSMEFNAINECRNNEIMSAIKDFKENFGSNEIILNESYLEPNEDGDTGIVHFFGIIEID